MVDRRVRTGVSPSPSSPHVGRTLHVLICKKVSDASHCVALVANNYASIAELYSFRRIGVLLGGDFDQVCGRIIARARVCANFLFNMQIYFIDFRVIRVWLKL